MTAPHNFELSEEQEMVRETVRKLVQDEVQPAALEHDEHRRFFRSGFDQLAELGMLGLPIGEESGGADMGWLSFGVALEELAVACGSTARLLLSQAGLCGKTLEGLDAAAEACAALASGDRLGAFVGPEFGIVAEANGAGYRLSGSASMVTAATEADLLVVATLDAAGEPLLFCLDAEGIAREATPALGFRASAPGAVNLQDQEVSGDSLVAQGADASAALERAALAACIGGGAIAVGMARSSYDLTLRYCRQRQAFGKALFDQQAVRHKLVCSLRGAQAARHMVYHAARLADRGEDASAAAMMAKLDAVAAAQLAADEGVQIHGGYGYVVEYSVERHYRDVQTLGVMDGAADALRDDLAQQM